ncbi:MAG: UbiA family prenyltransferase [Chloroflexi bacterium]|nr:UbiA family prenyltransferase [Chloroflexota bacterium]
MGAGDRPQQRAGPPHYAGRERSWRRSARGYFLLPHIVPVVVVELATAAFAVIAWGGLPPPQRIGPLLLAMLGGQLAIGAINELVDLPFDTVDKPWKPLPSGDVSIGGARAVVVIGLMMMIAFGWHFGALPFALLVLGTGLGIAYDLWFKRTMWSWLPYLIALPLLPIWVFAALGKPEPRLLLLYPLGALATVGVHLAQALPDVTIDREAGLETITSRLGEMRIFVFAWLATLSAPVLGWFAAQWLGASQQLVPIAIASGFAVLLLAINVILISADRRRGAIACFPLVATATLGTGLAWTLIVVR